MFFPRILRARLKEENVDLDVGSEGGDGGDGGGIDDEFIRLTLNKGGRGGAHRPLFDNSSEWA